MTRPYVRTSAHNQIAALRRHLAEHLPRFTASPGVVGLTLNGGMSRGYADEYSEVDITFFLESQTYQAWQSSGSPIAAGIIMLDGQLYDVKFADYAVESAREWDMVMLWDASYAEVLYDPKGLLSKMLAVKLETTPDIGAVEGLLMSCWWHYELAGTIWIHRGDVPQGHHMFNQAVVALLQALFIANREYVPHEKWLFHMSRSLAWKPADWENRLRAAMSTGDMTESSLRDRQREIRALWDEVDRYMITTYHPHLPVRLMQKKAYEGLKQLVEAGSMRLAEWRTLTGSDFHNADPCYPVIRLDDDRIIVDRDVLRIQPHDMYVWHYEVLQAVRAQYYSDRQDAMQ